MYGVCTGTFFLVQFLIAGIQKSKGSEYTKSNVGKDGAQLLSYNISTKNTSAWTILPQPRLSRAGIELKISISF